MDRTPFFKRCADCSTKIPPTDSHDHCLYCLGDSHQTETCLHCTKFTRTPMSDLRSDIDPDLHGGRALVFGPVTVPGHVINPEVDPIHDGLMFVNPASLHINHHRHTKYDSFLRLTHSALCSPDQWPGHSSRHHLLPTKMSTHLQHQDLDPSEQEGITITTTHDSPAPLNGELVSSESGENEYTDVPPDSHVDHQSTLSSSEGAKCFLDLLHKMVMALEKFPW
ncbi:UNVERIFIED_CONTAM: hypothetical protein K2H54_061737 [Gekko kuhli]